MNSTKEKGMWKRTFGLFTNIKMPVWLYLLQAGLGIASTKAALLYVPYETDVKMGNLDNQKAVYMYLGLMLLVVIIGIAAKIPEFYADALVNKRLQDKLIHRSLRLPVSSYESKASQIVSWITQDCGFANGLITAIVGFLTGIVSVIMTVSTMQGVDTVLTYVVVIVIVYILFGTWLEGKLMFLKERRQRRATSELTAFFAEHLGFFAEIKQLNTLTEESKRGHEAIRQFFRADIYQANLLFLNSFVSGSLTNVITILIFIIGIREVNAGTMSLSDLAAFQSYILIAYQSISSLPALYVDIMQYNGTLFFISSLMAEKEEVYERTRSIKECGGDIRLEVGSFGYGEGSVLKDVNLLIPEGRITLIAGPNGSGKTTLFKLFERFYTPEEGEMSIGGLPAEDFNLDEWRKNIAYVLQEPQIFAGTIRDNISFGLEGEAADDELDKAAKLALAYDFIHSLPGGYEYEVGENGSKLSGGQRQRLAIARAVLTDPAILLLDEPTSSLDAGLSKKVTSNLMTLMEGKTIVMISHDMKMLEIADNVVVVNDGMIEAQGTKEEVIEKSMTLKKLMQ